MGRVYTRNTDEHGLARTNTDTPDTLSSSVKVRVRP